VVVASYDMSNEVKCCDYSLLELMLSSIIAGTIGLFILLSRNSMRFAFRCMDVGASSPPRERESDHWSSRRACIYRLRRTAYVNGKASINVFKASRMDVESQV
jgi:hypothetical protein